MIYYSQGWVELDYMLSGLNSKITTKKVTLINLNANNKNVHADHDDNAKDYLMTF